MNNNKKEIDAGLLPADLSEADIDALYFKMMERDEHRAILEEEASRMAHLEHRSTY